MQIIKRENDKIINIKRINSIDNLNNDILILLERGDKIKKMTRGARTMFNNKNICSVKSLKAAIAANTVKINKKNNATGHFCCVCGDWKPNNQLDKDCVCHDCQLS